MSHKGFNDIKRHMQRPVPDAVTEVAYNDPRCALANEEIYVGDNTSTYLFHIQEESEDIQ